MVYCWENDQSGETRPGMSLKITSYLIDLWLQKVLGRARIVVSILILKTKGCLKFQLFLLEKIWQEFISHKVIFLWWYVSIFPEPQPSTMKGRLYVFIYLLLWCPLTKKRVSCSVMFTILIWQVYFWTGSPALPASEEGFQPMPSVTIRPADDSHLPTANTCISRLYIPLYTTRAILRSKLLLAIKTKNFGFVWKKWPKDR